MMMFKKAVRSQAKLKLAVIGPSGSGKTFSALKLASGLGKKIAVLDTENGSASLYSEQFEFDVVSMEPPFTTERYIQVIGEAVKAGYDVLILDSMTHAWAGEGGLLEQKESLDARGKGNSYTNWATITKKQEIFKSAMLHSPIHIIATMRSKQEYTQIEENGKKTVKKLGMAPVQRDGMEYEFTIVFDIAMNHEAEVSKDRTGLFADKYFRITEETGKTILKWLDSAQAVEPSASIDPAAYVVPIGSISGKKLSEVAVEDLAKILDWYNKEQKNGKTFGEPHLEFILYAERYLKKLDEAGDTIPF